MLVLNFTSLNSPACHLLCETVEALREWIFAFNSLKSENSFSLYLSFKNLNTSKSRIWGREFEGRHEPTFTRAKRKQNKSPESTGSLLWTVLYTHMEEGIPEICINLSQVVEAAKKWGQQKRAARVWSSWVATLAQTSLLPHGHYYGNNDYYYYRRIAIYWSAAPENLRIVRAQRRSHPAGPVEDIGMVEIKSDNLQYNMLDCIAGSLGCWVAGTNYSWTKHLMFQVLFLFHNFLQILSLWD